MRLGTNHYTHLENNRARRARIYLGWGVCGCDGGWGGKWGVLLVAEVQNGGDITYSILQLPAKIQFVPDGRDNVNLTSH